MTTLCPRIVHERNVPTPQKTMYLARSAQESSGQKKETPRKSTAALIINKILIYTQDFGYYLMGFSAFCVDLCILCIFMYFTHVVYFVYFAFCLYFHQNHIFSQKSCIFMKITISSKIAYFPNFHEFCPRIFQEKCSYPPENHVFGNIGSGIVWAQKETPRESTAALIIKKI